MNLFEAFNDELEKIAGVKRLDRLVRAAAKERSKGLGFRGEGSREKVRALNEQIAREKARLGQRQARVGYKIRRATKGLQGYPQTYGTGRSEGLGILSPKEHFSPSSELTKRNIRALQKANKRKAARFADEPTIGNLRKARREGVVTRKKAPQRTKQRLLNKIDLAPTKVRPVDAIPMPMPPILP